LKTENDVGGVPPQSIQENSLKKKMHQMSEKVWCIFVLLGCFITAPSKLLLTQTFLLQNNCC